MSNFNRVILLGRLTRDPSLKYTGSGSPVCELSLAVNRRVKKGEVWEEEASFFDVVVFGKTAENAAKYLAKGRETLIEGELRQRRWEAKDGSKRSKIEVVASSVTFVGARDADREADRDTERFGETIVEGAKSPREETPPPLNEDDIPF